MTADGLTVPSPQLPLAGRGPERARLRQLLATTVSGRSAVLVLRGDPGLGKTALAEDLASNATGHRVIRIRGTVAEAAMAYAALHLLCSALPVELARLETHQRDALETAVGLRAGPRPDRFVLCVAVLSLLTLAAEEQPVLCVVDDLQWLDEPSTSVLSFVARRVGPVPVALLFADRGDRVTGLPELVLDGLTHLDAHQLIDAALPAVLDHAVLERMIAEARGNPRVLLDSVRTASPVTLAGGYDSDPSYRGEPALLDGLAPASRSLLILAAAEPMGDPVRLWRAAARLGLEAGAAQQLEAMNLVSFGAWVVFRHPRLRWTIYGLASGAERRRAHEALALVTDPLTEPDRRVWHLAHSLVGTDDAVGDELARSAGKALERGGLAAAAAFLERAAICSADPGLRVERAVLAADAYHSAGAADAAVRLLAAAELGAPDALGRARIQRVRARMAFDASRGRAAVGQLMEAARDLEQCRPELAGPAYVEAMGAAVFTGHVDLVDEALVRLCDQQPGGSDRLIEGVAQLCTSGYAAAVEPLKLALKTFDQEPAEDTRSRLLSCLVAAELWDGSAWRVLTSEQLELTRLTGARTLLPYVLTHRALAEIQTGEFCAAESLVAEATATARAVGTPAFPHAAWLLAAWRGQDAPALPAPERNGRGAAAGVARYAAAILANGAGAYGRAVEATRAVLDHDAFELQGWSLPELVEGAVRAGDLDTAAEALDRLSERACLAGTNWALGTEAQSRALLLTGRAAEDAYQEAIDRLDRSGIRTQLARANLLYGEWLRRQGRRVDARGPLRAAHESFVAMGAAAFAERTLRELLATGERARRRELTAPSTLTAQENRIAALARDGRSNPEIATTLSISPRTVEYHLHKVFTKLAITSRTELHLVLADGPP
ncbi:AAA family ATPase [Kribbella sp. NPDC051770]|uniref:helix-turn-helix transcriptional regulator n=1 Tax=Kribbella sp. NPDC051770 TaxID=3155413 RepID=UPI0034405162